MDPYRNCGPTTDLRACGGSTIQIREFRYDKNERKGISIRNG